MAGDSRVTEIHGGVNTINGDIEWLDVHGGVLYVKGNVGNLLHHGGVMYDQRPSNRVEYRTDRMSEEERQIFRQRIAELERRLNQNESECLKLREKLGKQEMETPPDDVLIAKIKHLQDELESERADRKREVEELNDRIDVALEINAKLRHQSGRELIRQNIADRHVDILASLMALYPFTPDKDLVLEFNIPVDRIREVARVLGVIKSKEARQEAVEYLRKQHVEFIERRGGNQAKGKKNNNKTK